MTKITTISRYNEAQSRAQSLFDATDAAEIQELDDLVDQLLDFESNNQSLHIQEEHSYMPECLRDELQTLLKR